MQQDDSIRNLLNRASSVRTKENVIEALVGALQPGERREYVKRFVNYYFAHEKSRDEIVLSQSEVAFIYDKCKAALSQGFLLHRPRVKKLHHSKNLKEETVICKTKRTHGDHNGTRGWVNGWITTHTTDVDIDLELDEPMMVTRMMVHAVNVKASPRSMELYAKDEERNEWVLVRGFHLRVRDYEGSHGNDDYSKNEMFYVLGHSSSQQEYNKDDWEVHPLAGPGETTSGEPDHYMCSKYWRWHIIDSNGAGYVGINDFILYGREAVFPAPLNVIARIEKTGAKISWDPLEKSANIHRFYIITYPGGISHHSTGGFYEQCDGNRSACYIPDLSPGVTYQFQVVAVNSDYQEGIPSRASQPIIIRSWKPDPKKFCVRDGAVDDEDVDEEDFFEEYENLDGQEYISLEIREQTAEFPDGESAFSEVLNGNFAAVDQVANANKVTLYISGSLEDTTVERKYIAQYAIPKLELWCLANGYDFSGIDLRWGLASEVADDHETYAIHMQELERVYKNSSLSLFYFISGERYGSVLLPAVISKSDRDTIRAELKESMKWIVDLAYYLDENGDPPVYHLQRISKMEACRDYTFWDGERFRGIHSLMKEIMTVMMKSQAVSEQLKKWQPSLAMAECAYALNATAKNDKKNKFICGRRTLENLYKAMESERDLPLEKQKAREMGCVDTVERRAVHDLRTRLARTSNVITFSYSFDWKKDGIDISREDMSMKRLCSNLYTEVKKLIVEESKSRKVFDDHEQEVIHHALFVKSRAESFFGREALIRTIMANIAATNGKITVLHGVSGAGKTSVMCTCAEKAKIYLPEDTIVMIRLCGTSPQSSSAKGLLNSLCLQIQKVTSGEDEDIPDPFDELVDYFHELLKKESKTGPIAIFIDSLDQLSDEDSGRSQPWKWIPKRLPENVYFIVSTLPDSEYGILKALSGMYPRTVEVPLLPSLESNAILCAWMSDCHRTLTEDQRLIVQQCLHDLQAGITMLHLRLICDRVSQWSSHYVPHPLPLTVQGMIDRAYEELEKEHGKKLVTGFLSLLGSSKDGLTSENILDILSADEDALGGKGKEGSILERHDPPVRRVPPFLVARLKHDLREYLVERGANGIKVLGLYHRQFIEVAQKRYLESEENQRKANRQLIEYFNGESANKFIERGISAQPFWFFIDGDDRVPNRQKLIELPHALLNGGHYEEHANLITNFNYIESKCTAGGAHASSLIEDYILSLEKLDSGAKKKEVNSFFRFISTWFHVLKETPSCLTSLSLNYVPDSVVTLKMKDRWEQKLGCEEGGWIKWDNAPTAIDPCVFTNVIARADCITALKCSPDAQRCAVAGDRFCGLYDFRTHQLQCDFRGHSSWIRSVCFSPDGRYALSVSNDHTGRVWNSQNAEQCCVLSGHIGWIMGCDWSPEDHIVLTVSEDGTARLWNPYLGHLIGLHEHHGAALKTGTFMLSGTEVITGDVEGKIMKWSVPSIERTGEIRLKKAVTSLQWNETVECIAAATSGGQVLILSKTLETIRELAGFSFSVNSCVFSPNGRELLAAGAEKVGNVYDLSTGAILGRLVGHSKQIMGVDWMRKPDGDFLLTGSEDQTMKQWQRSDVIPGDVFETFAEGSWKPTTSFAIAITQAGDLYGVDGDTRLFLCSDVFGSQSTAPYLTRYGQGPQMGDKTCGALSPDGETWAICSYGHSSQIMSAEDGAALKHFSLEVCHNTLLWDPLGAPRFFASGHGEKAVIWNIDSGEMDCKMGLSTWVWDGSWSADGRFIAVANDDSTAVFDMTKEYNGGDTVPSVFEGLDSLRCALNSDGSRLAILAKTGKYYGSVASTGYLYDLSNLDDVEQPMELEGSFEHAGRFLFTSDDKYLLVSFSGKAFGSSPSICAFDAEFGIPTAWFVSPLNNDFSRMAVPYYPCSKFVVVDGSGKIYVFHVEEG